MADAHQANGIVRALDTGWVKLGSLLRLPSAQKATPAEPEPAAAPASAAAPAAIELPGGHTAEFKLLSLLGEYDFNSRASQYQSSLVIGKAKVRS